MAPISLNVPEKIILVLRDANWNGIEGYKQAFIVDTSNKEQLNKAREWARTYIYTIFNQRTEIVGKELYLDNKDFTLTMLDCANTSSQGGKLSFWNCLVEKDGVKTVIGIEQNNLLSLLKQSTLVNGVVQEKLSLAKSSGTGSVVHKGMHEWEKSKQVMELKTGPVKKTNKWELGKSYATATLESTYMCDVYCWFDVTEDVREEQNNNRGWLSSSTIHVTHYNIKLLDKPKKMHLVFENGLFSDIDKEIEKYKISTMSKLFEHLTSVLNNLSEKASSYQITNYAPLFNYNGSVIEKFPSRSRGRHELFVDEHKESLGIYFETALEKMRQVSKRDSTISMHSIIQLFGYSVDEKTKPIITDEMKHEILSKCGRTIHIDFGDKKVHTGIAY